MPTHTRPPGTFTPAATPASIAPHTQPRSAATTRAAAIRPTISRSLWRPATPLATISGDTRTTPEATAGFAPVQRASRGTDQASRASPTSARQRCATTRIHGLPVVPATMAPKNTGTGPYGVAVSHHSGSTACTIGGAVSQVGSGRKLSGASAPGPHWYGESPTRASIPWAA